MKLNSYKKYKLTIIYEIILLLFILFYKNTYIEFIENNNININIWKYVYLLNNNNNSIILILLIIFLNINIKNINFSFNILKYIFLITMLMFLNINIVIKNIYFNILKEKFINMNLINGVLLIHPFFMYECYVLYLIYSFLFYYFKYKNNRLIINIKKNNKFILNISFISLFLGSYWAQQELNWGGWWNWDFVEIISLIFFIFSCVFYHINLNKNLNYLNKFYNNIIYCFFIFFLLVRMDILNSIHSFNSLKISKNYFYIFYFSIFFYNWYYYKLLFKNKKKFNKNIKYKIKKNFLILIVYIFIIYINYNLITTYFLNLQYIEISKYTKTILFLYFNILIILFTNFNKNNLFIIILIFYFKFVLFIVNLNNLFLYFFKKYKNKLFIHNIMIIFLIDCFFKFSLNNYYITNKIYNFKKINNIILIKNNFTLNNLNCIFYFNSNNFLNNYLECINFSNILIKNNNLFINININIMSCFNLLYKYIYNYLLIIIFYFIIWVFKNSYYKIKNNYKYFTNTC